MAINHPIDLASRQLVIDQMQLKTCPVIWLRPDRRDSLDSIKSKLGGSISWPSKVKWPTCDGQDVFMQHVNQSNDYFVPAAQFLKDDYPEIDFPVCSDILQILWCPRFHKKLGAIDFNGPIVKAYWHLIDNLNHIKNPKPRCAEAFMIPNECALQPMRLNDVPWHSEWTNTQRQVFGLLPEKNNCKMVQAGATDVEFPQLLSPVPGTKLLGYPNCNFAGHFPVCSAGHKMAHLLTLSSSEVDSSSDWYLVYDNDLHYRKIHTAVCPVGLDIIDGSVMIFYCNVCPNRPIESVLMQG